MDKISRKQFYDAIIFIASAVMIYQYGDYLAKKLDEFMPNEEKMVEIM